MSIGLDDGTLMNLSINDAHTQGILLCQFLDTLKAPQASGAAYLTIYPTRSGSSFRYAEFMYVYIE